LAKFFFILFLVFSFYISYAQDTISLSKNQPTKLKKNNTLILPIALMTYGALSLELKPLQDFNRTIHTLTTPDNLEKKYHIDNYLQFTPGAIAIGLNAVGIKGKHKLKDAALIYTLSNVVLNGIVIPTKKLTHELRPDKSAYSSFPSGHTAEAFANATFLSMEYGEISVWYSISGYTIASLTGYLRMYNNKHWFGDVIAGAGVGIVSTKIAYWMFNKINKKKTITNKIGLMPTFNNRQFGFNLCKYY